MTDDATPRVGERAAEAASTKHPCPKCGAIYISERAVAKHLALRHTPVSAGDIAALERRAFTDPHSVVWGSHIPGLFEKIRIAEAETAALSARLADAEFSLLNAEQRAATAGRNAAGTRARAESAEASLARAEAALREARAYIEPLAESSVVDTYAYANRKTAHWVLVRLDAALAQSEEGKA